MPQGLRVAPARWRILLPEIIGARVVRIQQPPAFENPISENIIVVDQAMDQRFISQRRRELLRHPRILSIMMRKNRHPAVQRWRNKKPVLRSARENLDRAPDRLPVLRANMNRSVMAAHGSTSVANPRHLINRAKCAE